jgi:hypothetical protein
VKQKGRTPEFIDELANNASIRMKVRKCLRSHIDRLRCEVKSDHYLKEENQSKLTEIIGGIETSAIRSLDDMDQAVRELLQMVCSMAHNPFSHNNIEVNRNLPGSQKTRQPVSNVLVGLQ